MPHTFNNRPSTFNKRNEKTTQRITEFTTNDEWTHHP